jgi:diguanylate cyclase (GGDEF)-like protein/PAS domain S-box-containing protein
MKLQTLRDSHLDTGYNRRFERKQRLNVTAAVLLCSLIGLLVGIGMLVHEFNTARASLLQRQKLNYRMRDLQRVVTLLDEAESGQRGYLLTSATEYLAPYRKATDDLPSLLLAIKEDTREDALLEPRVTRIETLTQRKLAKLANVIVLHESAGSDAALDALRADEGEQLIGRAQTEVSAAVDVLRARREEGEERNLGGIRTVRIWTVLTCAALLICVAVYTWQIRSLIAAGRRYETRLTTQASILNTVVDEIPAMVSIWDRDQRYRLVNKAFERWSGKSRASIIDRKLAQLIGNEEFERSRPYVERALQGETVTYEKQYSDSPYEYVAFTYVPLILEGGEVGGVLSLGQDVTAQRSEQHRLRQLSERDALTTLHNRTGFERHLEAEIAAGRGATLGVIYIDLDHFKSINDRFGHAAGDEVLCAFAQRLRESVRPADVVARLGGDEFAVVLGGIRTDDEAMRVADSIVISAGGSFKAWGQSIRIGASVGVAVNASRHGGWRQLVARADEMAYASKSKGRGRASIYSADESLVIRAPPSEDGKKIDAA